MFMSSTSPKKRIAFIETNPQNLRGDYTTCNNFEPYGLELLAANSEQAGFEVKVFQQNMCDNHIFVKSLFDYSPDVLAFSCMTYNYESSLNMAKLAKNQDQNVKIIFGGPHISSNPAGLKNVLEERVVDYGIAGEGDVSFAHLMHRLFNKNKEFDYLVSLVGGLVYLESGELKINPKDKRIAHLDSIPFAVRDESILSRTKLGRVMNPAQSQQISTATISYSRGCPYSCSYCDSKNIWGNQVIWRSAKNVVDEIEFLKDNYGTNTIFFSDLTFNSNPQKVQELCDEMILRNANVKWYVLARAATPNGEKPLMDKELLAIMYEAGCRKIGYGLESVIPEVQKGFNKIVPNGLIADLVEYGHELGILNKGFIILGDQKYESPETIMQTLDVLKKIRFDEIRTSFLTPFPGSELYLEAQQNGRLITTNLSRYTTDEPVLKCDKLSTDQLITARKQITQGYYDSKEYKSLVRQKTAKFPELTKSYEEHRQFLRERKILLH